MQKINSDENIQNEDKREPILIEDIIFNNKDGSLKSYFWLFHSDGSSEVILEKKHTTEYLQLDTVLIVEYYIKKYSGHYDKYELLKALPTNLTFDAFLVIIDYLSDSGKISIDTEGKIRWLGNLDPGR